MESIIEQHYRYYQHHANAAIALAFTVAAWHSSRADPLAIAPVVDGLFMAIEAILIATSRDNLKKYFARASYILGPLTFNEERMFTMSNGGHPKPSRPPRATKPAAGTAKPSSKSAKS